MKKQYQAFRIDGSRSLVVLGTPFNSEQEVITYIEKQLGTLSSMNDRIMERYDFTFLPIWTNQE
jgi:hypothetical protein